MPDKERLPMAELFEIGDLVKVAVEDERTGVALYGKLAEKSDKLSETFAELQKAERHHQQQFEGMLTEVGGQKTAEEYEGQYMAYLLAMTASRALPDPQTAVKMAEACSGDAEAVALANRLERDTLILLNELRGMVPPKHAQMVDVIVAEERGHLITLAKAAKLMK
jgi:rubrerythrin